MELYLWLNIATIIPTFALSWDKKVHFYTSFKSLFYAIGIVGIFFIVWDIVFTKFGVWEFNQTYLTGVQVINLPIEEWLFFITVPYACIFTHFCLMAYFPSRKSSNTLRWVLAIIGILLIVLAFYNASKVYTLSAFAGAGVMAIVLAKEYTSEVQLFLRSYGIILIPFLLVNGVLTGGMTEEPVVIYNNSENLGIRIWTIPVEDVFYNFILLSLINYIMINTKKI